MPYFPQKWKPIERDEFVPDSPPSPAGRHPVELPAAAEQRIVELRERGETFAKIADSLEAEFGLTIPISTLHKFWIEKLEPMTDDGKWIARMQRLFGLSKAFWRRHLAADRAREAREAREAGQAASPSSPGSPATGPTTPAASPGSRTDVP